MAKILIIYQSKTGNTEKMAKAVEAGAKREGVTVVRKRLEEASVDDLPQFDGVILGSPTYFASCTAEVKRFIDDSVKHYPNLAGKVGAAFSSSGDLGGGSETAVLDLLRFFLVHGMIVPGYTTGGHYGPVSVGAPDEGRIKVCEALGQTVAKLVKRLA
jgi:NAD(P)H dehydrogenase (quinone)